MADENTTAAKVLDGSYGMENMIAEHTKDIEAAKHVIKLLEGQVARSSKARSEAALELGIAKVRSTVYHPGKEHPTSEQITARARAVYRDSPVLMEDGGGWLGFCNSCRLAIPHTP